MCKALEHTVCCHADDSTLTTPAAGPGLGVHGMSIQSHGEGQVHTGLSPGAQGNTYDQDLVVAQAASSPRAASPSTGGASSIPMASLGPAAAPAASSAASVAAAGSSAGPAQQDQAPAVAQAAPTTVAATNGIAICLLLCPVSFQQGHLLMTCKLLRRLTSLCRLHAH